MEFLLFTLTVGSFLMVFPYLSEGSSTTLEIDGFKSLGSAMNVTCEFEGVDEFINFELLNGDREIQARFIVSDNKYASLFPLYVQPGTTIKKGALTFLFRSVECKDFTWYMCTTQDGFVKVESQNETLKISPTVRAIQSRPPYLVNELSTFTCQGIVSKEGTYSVEWYRTSIRSSNRLMNSTKKLINVDQCSRTVVSTLTYNISEFDVPNLLLFCEVKGEKSVHTSANISVQAGLDPGSIVGIVLGVTAVIVLVVLLVWFLVIRPKRLKADGPSKDKGPEPNAKDYQVQENVLYATVDPLKKHNYKSSSSSLDGPDTNSNSVQDTGTAARNQKPNKQNAFLPSHGDATDNMDEAYELPPPPPPPPPKPHRSPRIESSNPLHYAELELAVQKSAKRRSEYGQRPNTDYAVISHS